MLKKYSETGLNQTQNKPKSGVDYPLWNLVPMFANSTCI